ncbi:maltose/maltodextrin ABC transporter substrate-binding protein MalE [Eleftheria terrae]|uniref:maltose/maltodextrin ABC transporter substrate-binding protein MalE n=1 Tax=Eleftheria terrae TaxID=1597781 RepID=UPI00263AF667|nr:maltose/maltodextrin ABC transporter substrate-binding protein MalE [Eleftheria terrae]WKB52836.1 maltose/maltodextrin ABC transporter substrate-binding protein MalE [Eleftheria terrae]
MKLLVAFALCGNAWGWEKGALKVWVNADKGYAGLQKVGEEYTRRTGVKVQVEHFDNAVDRFEAAMKAGQPQALPDIWIWPHDRLGEWVARGWLAPVKPAEAMRADIVQVAWDGFMLAGQTWGYPLAMEAVALVYNEALVPTPPKTFEEVLALQERLQGQGVRAIGWETGSPYFSWPLMAAGGGYVFQRKLDGSYNAQDTGINHAGAVRGAEYLQQLIRAGVIPANGLSYADAEADMRRGKQAMWITGPWAWEGLRAANVKFSVAPLPTLAGKPARPFVGVLGAMLTPTPNREAAVDFLENHLLKPEGLSQVNAARPLGVPASKQMFWKLYADPKIRISMDAIYAGRPMPSNTEMTFFWQHLSAALRDINAGKPAKEALDAAAAAVRSQQGAPRAGRP